MAERQCARSLLLAASVSVAGVLAAAPARAQPDPNPPTVPAPGDPSGEQPAEAEPNEPVFPLADEDKDGASPNAGDVGDIDMGDIDMSDIDVSEADAGEDRADPGNVMANPDEVARPMPWADGVPPEKQERASMLYKEANKLVEITSVAAAVEKYRQALVYWDHPMIRYNLAVVLMEMERPIEAYEHIVAALRFGVPPLGPANHKRAMRDRRALQARLVSVVVRCARPGVEISLNGQMVLQGPGEKDLLIKPGQHQLLAKGGGFATVITSHPLWPDRHYDIAVDPEQAIKRRWTPLVPWTVLGTGLGLSAVGGLLHWRARQNFEDFDRQIATRCPDGCDEVPDDLTGAQSRAKTQNRAAGVLYVLGGGMAVTGAVLWFLNRPRKVDREAFEVGERAFDVAVAPIVSEDAIGLTAAGSF